MDRKLFFTLLVFSFTLFIVYQTYSVIAPFLTPLVLAGVIGITTAPFHDRVCRTVKNPTIAALAMVLAVILVCVVPLGGLAFFLTEEATDVYKKLEAVNSGSPGIFDTITRHPQVAPVLERISPFIGQFGLDIHGTVITLARKSLSLVVAYSGGIAKNIFAFLFKLFMMVIALFFVYRDGDRFQHLFWSVIPLDEERKGIIIDIIKRVLWAVMYGIFLASITQGALGGIGFWIAGLPAPLLFSAAMAVCALIPVVGTALIWAPAAFYLLLQGRLFMGLFLLVWGAVAISSVDNIIRPVFISGKARLSVLVIALGILGGVVSFGFAGIVVGPVILAVFMALFEVYRSEMVPRGNSPFISHSEED